MDKNTLKKLKSEYFICCKCATGFGARLEGCHTFSNQTCPFCKKEVSCNAITDWYWDKNVGIDYIWD